MKPKDMKLSEHFSVGELYCSHCETLLVTPQLGQLLDKLEALREDLGNIPVIVTSGYRCPTHNQAVGGVPNSWHINGGGADLYVPGKSMEEVARAAERVGLWVLNEGDHVHVDVRSLY